MDSVYNLAVSVAAYVLKILALFQPKLRLFVDGRKQVFNRLQKSISDTDSVIWVHAASLGEYEQGLPVIEGLKEAFPDHKVLLTFFSPSGYEVKKNSTPADLVSYLPLDTWSNAKRFVRLARPKLAVFIKYEIWPNYLKALKNESIPAVLISAIFRKEQIFFKWYGGFMRRALSRVRWFFVQNKASEELLQEVGIEQCSVSGDTRFDRVSEILKRDNTLPLAEEFKGKSLCVVAGSTWPEDEAMLLQYIADSADHVKFILVPHDIKSDHIAKLRSGISKPVLLFSEYGEKQPADHQVLIVNTVGILTKIYSYADIAYVGGGFATGLHNTLEPAVFGIPVLIGPKYQGFREAEELVAKKGILVVAHLKDLTDTLDLLVNDRQFRETTGGINREYIAKNRGASIQIMEYLRKLL